MINDELRKEIDAIDDVLLDLFIKRMNLVIDIAENKKQNGLPVFCPEREKDILNKISEKTEPSLRPYACSFFSGLLSLSRAAQNRAIHGDDPNEIRTDR